MSDAPHSAQTWICDADECPAFAVEVSAALDELAAVCADVAAFSAVVQEDAVMPHSSRKS